jgi:hypothetical protein
MAIPILCLVTLFFLSWVVVLKAEIQGLKEKNKQMAELVQKKVQDMTKGVEAKDGRRLTRSEVDFAGRKATGGRPAR